MSDLLKDIRFALRMLRTSPGFTAVVVLTLALGIAANSAVFSVFNTVLLRPLPFRDSGQLVALWETISQFTGRTSVSHPNFLDWKHQSQLFEGMAAYTYGQANLSGIGEPERIREISTSEGYFSVLGVTPLLGRPFSAGEHGPGANRVTILSHGCWQRRFGSRSDVLDQKVMLDGYPHVIVGVMPVLSQGFEPDVWTPEHINPADDRGNFVLGVVGRLKPGVSVEQAQTEMTTIARRLELQYPDSNKGVSGTVTNLQKDLFGDLYQQIWISLLASPRCREWGPVERL